MIRDVFYYGKKPNAHPREKHATDLQHARSLCTTDHFWVINEYCDYKNFDWEFDFEFLPDEDVWAENHNNVWPSQHQKDSGTWLCSKNHSDIIIYRNDVSPIYRKPTTDNWIIPDKYNTDVFDFSWHPDPTSPPYIYQFGSYLDKTDGPQYNTPGNDGSISHVEFNDHIKVNKYFIETTLDDLVKQHPDEIFWALNKNINYDNFDFNWLPTEEQSYNVSVFGSTESLTTHTYFVCAKRYLEGRKDFEYIDDKKLDDEYLSDLFQTPNIFYVDRGNKEATQRYNELKLRYPVQKTRYVNSWIDTINRCVNKSETELFYVLDSTLDYTDFDFKYYPNPWQMNMVHVFGTQYNHWGTTYLINKNTFTNDTKYIERIEHLSNLNFVKTKRAKAVECQHEIILIDYGNPHIEDVLTTIKNKVDRLITVVKYENSYFDTIKSILNSLPIQKDHFIWICSSICDYTNFDFNYIIDPFTREQVHVFPSGNQKYGDTFFVNVNQLRNTMDSLSKLEDYNLNFNKHLTAKRFDPPVISCSTDNHLCGLHREFNFPYAEFRTMDSLDLEYKTNDDIVLWTKESKNIVISSAGASIVFVPKEATEQIKTEFYDYPYISKSATYIKSKPLDIVFLSNGESCAEENYEHLLDVTRGLKNRVVRVDGVNGRVNAYHSALNNSNSAWAFTVFAKLKINNNFDFDWQPDRLQIPKHYIFYATNPVNGLVYGHQAMIAYNKKLVLCNHGIGLDFTLDDPHEVVPIDSGVAMYNTDPYSTWRTAFRECIKLCHASDVTSKQRLETWLSVGNGIYGEYSVLGAKQAVDYYAEVNGDISKLKMSYEWAWLKEKFKETK